MKKATTLLVLAMAAPTRAEEPPVHLGSRVRMHTAMGSLEGQLVAWERDRFTVNISGLPEPYVLRAESVQRLDVSQGRTRPWLRGALAGAAMGALLMAAAPVENACPPGVQPGVASGCETKTYNVQTGIAGGAVIGMIISATRQVDRWKPVPLSRFRVSVAPAPKGVAASLTLTP
ncbi:MAG TPA: hypothetical protein VFM88_16060 [Vicinamibacteria bacterium]|nr:hypothetical protein [Vicinamibacteria bacterium]